MDSENKKEIIKEGYAKAANNETCSCSTLGAFIKDADKISKSIGYSEEELNVVPEANMGLGCGNPIALAEMKEGLTVLDLGSGAGMDCFLAADKVGSAGKVIGVDMTQEMIDKARANAEKYNYNNVEFRLGEIENLPVDDNSIDIIISNCVINLAPCKTSVFKDAFRVLKPGASAFISDMILLDALSNEQKNNKDLLCSCVAGAIPKESYIEKLESVGFSVEVLAQDNDLSKKQYHGAPVASLKTKATKPL